MQSPFSRGLKDRFGVHHGVRIQRIRPLSEAVVLSSRYIPDGGSCPTEAIDLIDEAAAMIRTEIRFLPSELDEVNRKSCLKSGGAGPCAKETDQASFERLEKLENELFRVRHQQGQRAQWESEKGSMTMSAKDQGRHWADPPRNPKARPNIRFEQRPLSSNIPPCLNWKEA